MIIGAGSNRNQALSQITDRADMDGASVEKRSPAPLCQKQLIPIGLIYDSQLQLSPVTQSQRKGAAPEIMNQVGGPVHRIQYPYCP